MEEFLKFQLSAKKFHKGRIVDISAYVEVAMQALIHKLRDHCGGQVTKG